MSEPNAKNTSDLLDGAEPVPGEDKNADDQNIDGADDQTDDDAGVAADDSTDDQPGDDAGKDDDDDHEANKAAADQQASFDDRHAQMLARTAPASPAVAARTSRETADSPRADEADSSTELGEDDDDDVPMGDMTIKQFQAAIKKQVEDGIAEGLGKARKADGVLSEKSDMYTELSSLAADYGLTKEEVDEAVAEGNLMVSEDDKTIPGGPSRFARAVGKEMHMIASRKARPQNARKAAADAEDKVRKQLNGQQPGKIDAPPGKVLSEKDDRLRKMNAVVGKNASSLIDK